jgi:drug/metabolite transporter (DMT)-like permease
MTESRCVAAGGVQVSVLHHSRRPVDMMAGVAMLVFCLALGLQQVAIKAVAAEVSPLAQIAIRSFLAALLVGGVMVWRGARFAELRAGVVPGLLVGLGFTFEFVFVAVGLNYTLASHMSVFLYTAPIFAALGLHFLVPGEQLVKRQWLGMMIAFGGLVVAMAPIGGVSVNGATLLGDMLGLLAGASWAMTTLVLRRSSLSEAPPLQTLFYQLVTAAMLLLPVAALRGDLGNMAVTTSAVTSLAFQTLVISFGVLLLWFALLRRYLASQLGVLSFLAPIFGVMFGAMLLEEPLTTSFLIGGVILLGGVMLVTRPT